MGAPRGGGRDRLRHLGHRAAAARPASSASSRPHETPDGRPGIAVLLFAMSGKELAKQLERRVGQCVLTCPTTAVFAGIAEGEAVALGKNLRFFGDGWQIPR